MLEKWRNERGLTLIELLAAVAMLSIVFISFASIGTAAYKWNKEDAQSNQAVVLAEQKLLDAKRYFETNHTMLTPAMQDGTDAATGFTWHIDQSYYRTGSGASIQTFDSLLNLTVKISGPNLDDPTQSKEITRLSSIARARSATP